LVSRVQTIRCLLPVFYSETRIILHIKCWLNIPYTTETTIFWLGIFITVVLS
jgi:hypothetical protein